MQLLRARFIKFFVPEREIDYDERIFGRHGCKQHICGKAIRFGYKVYCINRKSRYFINYRVYQGTLADSNVEDQKMHGKASARLIRLIHQLALNGSPFSILL